LAQSNLVSIRKNETADAGWSKTYTPEYDTSTAYDSLTEVNENVNELKEKIKGYPERTTKNISLSNIGVTGYRLTEPLQVTIIAEDSVFVAVSYDLNTFGYGDTEAEAIQDLRESIVEYYEDLKGDRENLGKVPQCDFEYLDRILKAKN